MANHILKCNKCNIYTLMNVCPNCSLTTSTPKPAKYSPLDKYGHYRREARKENDMEDKET